MPEVAVIGGGWTIEETSFSPAEMEEITGLPQQLLRLWRSRGYLPKKDQGRWSRHSAKEVASAYLLHALSRLGVSPSDAVGDAATTSRDLLFFAMISGDGACEFTGQSDEAERLRFRFEDDLGIARMVTKPANEDRFILSLGARDTWRCPDLCRLIENEGLEYFFSIDLLVAGRKIAERAGRPLYSFIHETADSDGAAIRRLSRAR